MEGFKFDFVSRTRSKLVILAQEIESKHSGTQTKAPATGFANNDLARCERLTALVNDLHITIGINNVGKTSGNGTEEIITINVNGTHKFTQNHCSGLGLSKDKANLGYALFRRFASCSPFGHILSLEGFLPTIVHRYRGCAQTL